MLPSKNFLVLAFMLRALIYFGSIFVYGVRVNFILLHVDIQFSQHHLFERLNLPPLNDRETFAENFHEAQYILGFISGLFHWSLSLSLY